jgi:hypothetical protein
VATRGDARFTRGSRASRGAEEREFDRAMRNGEPIAVIAARSPRPELALK